METDPELPVTPDFLSKYVAYARSEVDPGIEDDNQIKDRVADYYSSKREDVGNVVNTNDIESIIRFSEASARARLSETIEIEDIDRAIRIVDSNPRYQD
nr:hypothetical protein [Halorutilus salinus]